MCKYMCVEVCVLGGSLGLSDTQQFLAFRSLDFLAASHLLPVWLNIFWESRVVSNQAE